MSNYITIESGHFLPFKENETDPELKIWADKYYGIIGKVHDALAENKKRYEKRYAHLKELFDRIVSLRYRRDKLFEDIKRQYNNSCWDSILEVVERQTRDQLLQSSFKDEMDAVFDDSEIGFFMDVQYYLEGKNEQDLSLWRYNHIFGFPYSEEYIDQHIKKQDDTLLGRLSELKEELRECLMHRVWKGNGSMLINESNIVNIELVDRGCLEIRTGVWTIKVYAAAWWGNTWKEEDRIIEIHHEMRKNLDVIINDIKSMENSSLSEDILDNIIEEEFFGISLMCSIQEAYNNFQTNNIEKIKKDKIKCGRFESVNEINGIRVYT